ncbi:MAG: hypothetical protein AAF515_18785 [Pseudomonadota bacterium]
MAVNDRDFDRRTRDVGNIIALEHVNLTVPDQQLAHLFYVTALGFTRDPYMDFGLANMWINVGRQQFHLPVAKAQRLRGRIGLVVPSLDGLEKRLTRMQRYFEDTRMKFRRGDGRIDVTCPWGNRLICHEAERFGMSLGMPYVELDVPPDTVDGICRFYRTVLKAPARRTTQSGAPRADVCAGYNQTLRFIESDKRQPKYDGHHLAIYVANFSGPHRRLRSAGLITEESDEDQYRFQAIVDPKTDRLLFEIEHEVRSLHHPMHGRPLAARNPAQSFFGYRRGHDQHQG